MAGRVLHAGGAGRSLSDRRPVALGPITRKPPKHEHDFPTAELTFPEGTLDPTIGANVWELVSTSPWPVGDAGGVVRQDRFFHAIHDGGAATPATRTHIMYDIVADTWTQLANFPGLAANSSGSPTPNFVAAGGYVYVLGGVRSNGLSLSEVWRYNPADDTWTQTTSLSGDVAASRKSPAVSHNGVIYMGNYRNSSNPVGKWQDFIGASWATMVNWPYPSTAINGGLQAGMLTVYNGGLFGCAAADAFAANDERSMYGYNGTDWTRWARIEGGTWNAYAHIHIVGGYMYAAGGHGGVRRLQIDPSEIIAYEQMNSRGFSSSTNAAMAWRQSDAAFYTMGYFSDLTHARAFELWRYRA